MKSGFFDPEKASLELRERYNISFVDLFIKNGFTTYLFGGSLRDMVLGKDWKDADIRAWLPLPPKERDEMAEQLLKQAGIEIKSKIIFNDTFTIYRFLPEGSKANGVIDFTVVTGQWVVDPDFGMNGLYFDIGKKELIDKYNSLDDIEKKIIRTIKDPFIQFKDEPQMIFRAVKAACQFGFDIEENTFKAMKELSLLTEGTMGAVADDIFPGLTEWFIGNIFRGLKYDPQKFEKIWKETGIMATFINFIANRLLVIPKARVETEPIFKEAQKYGYEESISLLFSYAAREIDKDNPELIFNNSVDIFYLRKQSKYGDFVVDIPQINYID